MNDGNQPLESQSEDALRHGQHDTIISPPPSFEGYTVDLPPPPPSQTAPQPPPSSKGRRRKQNLDMSGRGRDAALDEDWQRRKLRREATPPPPSRPAILPPPNASSDMLLASVSFDDKPKG